MSNNTCALALPGGQRGGAELRQAAACPRRRDLVPRVLAPLALGPAESESIAFTNRKRNNDRVQWKGLLQIHTADFTVQRVC